MAGVGKARYIRQIATIFIIIGALWGYGLWQTGRDVANAREACEPEPTPSPTTTVSPTGTPTARSTSTPTPTPTPTPTAPAADDVECETPGLVNLGLDLQGGISVVLAPREGQDVREGTLEQAAEIIRNRVDALGVAEPDIAVQGENILIQLPGLRDQARALQLIGTTAKLRFRPVLANVGDPAQAGVDCTNPDTWPTDDPAKEVVFCVKVPNTPRAQWYALRLGPVQLEGSDVSGADASLPPVGTGGTGWQVNLRLSREGSRKFEQVTGDLACNRSEPPKDQLAIVLDRVIESHPPMGSEVQCNEGIPGGSAVISGSFGEGEAKDLALVLEYGALPIELERSTTTTISPTLGRESLRAGMLAGAIGLVVVLLYVLVFYRGLGLVIWLGVAVHGLFTFGAIVLLGKTAGFTLSLAGIAGLIVSLGVAADSFIVYFERIKDEVRTGRTLRASVDRAWASAWRTIVAADLVTALAAVVLYFLAVGSVRGFALMLGLATFLDLFVSRWYMHPSVWLLSQSKRIGESRMGIASGVGMSRAEPAPVSGGQQ